ncbi:MAG TPA: BON domain-containing protein [Candidatus Eisenbacteria bacterium]|nr:BON domain-containing protein [Candidatus Eisenbacteria bacterium]
MDEKTEGNVYNKAGAAGAFLGGLAVGAAMMYMTDPDGGARRRAALRDKGVRAFQGSQDFIGKTTRDLRNRAEDLAETPRRLLKRTVSDDVLRERVRSKMGHYVSHPRAVRIRAYDGMVTLVGAVLSEEAPRLIKAVSKVPGVKGVDDQLERHDDADVPSLQGEVPGGGEEMAEQGPSTWSPGMQLIVGAATVIGLLGVTQYRRIRHSSNGGAQPIDVTESEGNFD